MTEEDNQEFFNEEETEFNDEDDNQTYSLDTAGNSAGQIFSSDTNSPDPQLNNFTNCLSLFQNVVSDIIVDQKPNKSIEFSIPSDILPLTLRVAYGFIDSDILLTCWILLDDYNWRKPPNSIEITNPINNNYYGKCLVENAREKFFSPSYEPKRNYRSAPLLLLSQNPVDDEIVTRIMKNGYNRQQAYKSASLFENDYDKSITFLQTGQYNLEKPFEIVLTYDACPLLYFVLEILDSILDLQDHCAMCGTPTTLGLKPGVCTKQLCLHQFITVGVGVSLLVEIKRDVLVADFLFSVFCSSYKTHFFNPRPDFLTIEEIESIVDNMPRMNLLSMFSDDKQLYEKIGSKSCDLLRWIILTCRSNLLFIPKKLEIPLFVSKKRRCFQFMALTASPEQENIFQQMKKVYGSRFLFHGSSLERWHTIIRQGLKNMTGTKYMRNGDSFGEGIYFASFSRTSIYYSAPGLNLYQNSSLGKEIRITALCEVINFPVNQQIEFEADVVDNNGAHIKKKLSGRLNDFDCCYTLTMNEASIVRFLFVNLDVDVDMKTEELKNLPTLTQVLKSRAHII